MQAKEFLLAGLGHMEDRASTYDSPEGERSMSATVTAFNAVTGDGLMNTEERGWLFMQLLKAVRSQQGEFRADSYEDGASYAGLAGEAAYKERGAGNKKENWPASADDRMVPIFQNGNDGAHYDEDQSWIEHDGTGCPANPKSIVAVKLRNGAVNSSRLAEDWDWVWREGGKFQFDITHYNSLPPGDE